MRLVTYLPLEETWEREVTCDVIRCKHHSSSLPLFHVLDFTFHFLQILNNVCYEVDVHIFKNVRLSVSE